MAFIRIKKINNTEYAYLVDNKWYKRKFKTKGQGTRQTVSKYLGRVYSFDRTAKSFPVPAEEFSEYRKKPLRQILRDLVEWELDCHNVDRDEYEVDLTRNTANKRGKPISLKFNEGYLNAYTLKKLMNIKPGDSYELAKTFVDAGINIPKELFVELFA